MLLFNTLMFVFGFAVWSLQPVLPLNPDGKGMLAPDHDLQLGDFVPHEHQPAALLGRAAPFLFQPDFLRLLEHVPLGKRGLLRPGGDHPRPAQRPAHGQLLPRHVAGLRLYVRARQPGHGRAAVGRRRAHDARRQRAGRPPSSPAPWGPTTSGKPQAQQQISPRPGGGHHSHQAPGHQRRRVLRGQFGAPLREPQRVEQLPHGHELLPVSLRPGADVRPHVAADASRLGDLRRDDVDVRRA